MGSNDKLFLLFLTTGRSYAGGIEILFTSTPQFKLYQCNSWTAFPNSIPAELMKTWRITKTRCTCESDTSIRLQIHCNNNEVLKLTLSDEICNDNSDWRDFWNKDVELVYFHRDDTASDYYRLYLGPLSK